MELNVSEQIAKWLRSQNLNQVFCVTGGGAMFLNHALSHKNGFDVLYMHHEQACAMAAEGYARIAGKPAIVNVTTGPGAINALNGVFGAYTDSIPMIVISGQVKRETCLSFHDLPKLRQLGDQEASIIDMVRPITKYAHLIRSVEELAEILPLALQKCLEGRPGPVWLDIPIDIQSKVQKIHFRTIEPELAKPIEPSQLDEVICALLHAKKPLILAGTGVRLANATNQLQAFIETFSIPMATAWTHDLIASDHALFAGRPGTIGTRSANMILQQCDCLIVIGSRLNIRQSGYNFSDFAKGAKIIQVDIDDAELHKPSVQSHVRICADAKDFIVKLSDTLQNHALPSYQAWLSWILNIQKIYPANEAEQAASNILNPYHVIAKIFDALDGDEIIVCGNASACIIPFQVGSIKGTQRMFSNSGSASMGFDLPAAIGALKAASGERIICFAGDGSLQMNIQELETLQRTGERFVLFVIDNGGYVSIRQSHLNFFGDEVGTTKHSGVGFPNYGEVAKAYGLDTFCIENESDFIQIPSILNHPKPCVCVLKVDPSHGFVPRIKSRMREDGTLESPQLDDMFPFLEASLLENIRKSGQF